MFIFTVCQYNNLSSSSSVQNSDKLNSILLICFWKPSLTFLLYFGDVKLKRGQSEFVFASATTIGLQTVPPRMIVEQPLIMVSCGWCCSNVCQSPDSYNPLHPNIITTSTSPYPAPGGVSWEERTAEVWI